MFLEKFWSKEACRPVSRNLFFYSSTSVHVKSIKDWNNIIDKIHFTSEDFMKQFEVIKKNNKKQFSNKTTLITILDIKHNPLPTLLNNNILPFLSLWFSFVSLFACLTYRVLVFLFFLYQDLRNLKHHIHPVGFDLKFVSFYYFSVFLIRLPLFTDYTFITLYVIFAEKMFFIVTVI